MSCAADEHHRVKSGQAHGEESELPPSAPRIPPIGRAPEPGAVCNLRTCVPQDAGDTFVGFRVWAPGEGGCSPEAACVCAHLAPDTLPQAKPRPPGARLA